ncbi:MAG: hypothetical protein KJZ79_17240 [Bryobacteraceae bacterium]|nr:hypothetical protein [Bryobacteraceae bacterium]
MNAPALLAAALLLAPGLASADDPPKRPDPVKWTLSAAPSEAKPGQIFRVTLLARVAEGWHLYSMEKKEGGPIPTTITLPGPQWFKIAGRVEPPVGITSFDEGFDMEVETYLGEAEFTIPIEVLRDVKPAPLTLKIAARYQACDNRECLPPKTVTLEHKLRIIE